MKLAFALLLFIAPVFAQTDMDVRLERERSNRAIASRDINTFADTLDSDFVMVRGSGEFVASKAAYVALFREDFSDPKSIVYHRTPEKVDVSFAAPLAAERGRWEGRTAAGKIAYSGTYMAMWRKTDHGWKLRSELFVVLACGEAAECKAYTNQAAAAPAVSETGFLNRTVNFEGSEYRYQVYVPREFQRTTLWPVIVELHGGGEYGNDGLRQTAGALARAIHLHPERFPAIVVFPQAHADGTPGWQTNGGKAALAALDKTIAEFNGDPNRVYLTGYSAGGNGTWYLAVHHPERFAAVVPVCGFVSKFRGNTSGVAYPAVAPSTADDPYAAIAQSVVTLPIWIFHGDADKSVSVEESRHMFAALKAIHANVQYTELPGVDHNAWDPAYDNAAMLTWLFQQKRK